MIITALCENTACSERYGCEHGLSLYIRTKEHRILFDTGQSDLFAQNAAALGIDLSEADVAVLSHGHYDHGGGLLRFRELNPTAPILLRQGAFEPHYNASGKYIGLDERLRDDPHLIFTDSGERIAEGITLITLSGRELPYPIDADGLTAVVDGERIHDDFDHEQALLIEEDGRRVLFSGCSHKGALNYSQLIRPDVFVGGFHYMHTPPGDTLKAFAERLDRFDTDYITCHCTGEEQYAFLSRHMRRLRYLSSGESVTI